MKTLYVDDVEFHVLDEGTGTPLVLLHGFPLNHAMWRAQIDAFRDSYRVIAPDLRGFGGSSMTEGTVTMERHADDVAAILDGLGVDGPVVLCGLSMGGYIAFQFARKYASRLRGLILCDTRSAPDTPEGAAGRAKLGQTILAQGPVAALEAMLPKLFARETPGRNPDVVEQTREMILTTAPAAMAASLAGMAVRPDATPLLAGIEVPTLVLAGTEDRISPPDEMRRIAAGLRRAKFVEISQAGHMAPMENPEEVNAALRAYLASLE